MNERFVPIRTSDGAMETFITHPDEGGPFPAVVLYMDIWGVREELYDIARRVGTVGYYVLVPDLYYRWGKIRFEFRDERNQARSIFNLTDEERSRVREPLSKLKNAMVMDDTAAILEFVKGEEAALPGGMGSIGYCLGGRMVLCAAGTFPERFIATASLHGTELVSEKMDSPHRLADRFRGELYCGFGELDPAAGIAADLARAIESSAVRYRPVVHPGAPHGYALPDRDVYDKQAAMKDWEMIFAMFRRQIPAP